MDTWLTGLMTEIINEHPWSIVEIHSENKPEEESVDRLSGVAQGPRGDRAPEKRAQSLGSGFIIDATGYIVTNNHVVAELKNPGIQIELIRNLCKTVCQPAKTAVFAAGPVLKIPPPGSE